MKDLNYVTLANGQDCSALFGRMEIIPPLITEAEKKAFRDKLFSAQGRIEKALKDKWVSGKDFEVGWDFDYSYSLHGGIYSPRIFCPEYVEIVVKAICSSEDPHRWVYHTVCEIEVNPNGKTPAECIEFRGEFYITYNTIYIYESQMKREFREMLGTKD